MNKKITQKKRLSKKTPQITKLILASESKNRQQALKIAHIPFKVVASRLDEQTIRDPSIYKQAVKIAKAKVEIVSRKHSGIILGADGVNFCQGRVLEKPTNREEAVTMLQLQSGQICSFVTGFYLLNTFKGTSYSGVSETVYKFRVLSEAEIEAYVKKAPVMDWAAAFSPANSRALTFIEYIHGSYSNFSYSLPFEKIIPLLQREKLLV